MHDIMVLRLYARRLTNHRLELIQIRPKQAPAFQGLDLLSELKVGQQKSLTIAVELVSLHSALYGARLRQLRLA